MNKYDIIIIGAGASGLTAALKCSEYNKRVLLIEHEKKAGKKILITGNGKCNLTNENMSPDFYRGDKSLIEDVLSRIGYKEVAAFFRHMGLMLKSKNGYVYPNSGQASSVLDILVSQCLINGTTIRYNCNVYSINHIDNGYSVETSDGMFICDNIILATGSMAYPKTGSDGSGYKLLSKMGYKINKPLPALCGLKSSENFCKDISGVRADGKVTLIIDHIENASESGEIQFTDYGISGIPVFQISRFASRALASDTVSTKNTSQNCVVASIDFMPDMSESYVASHILEIVRNQPKKNLMDVLSGIFNNKLSLLLIKRCGLKPEYKSAKLEDMDIQKIAQLIKNFTYKITGTNNFDNSQICCGGVDFSMVNSKSLESLTDKNLYIIGELLDVDGMCGGYNLHWAWATGMIAAASITKDETY